MIGHLSNLTRWEWFKLRRRLMPWVLLAILVALSQTFVWANFFSHRGLEARGPGVMFGADGIEFTCREVMAGDVPAGLPPDVIAQWRQQCEFATAAQQQQLAQMRQFFTLPGSLMTTLGLAQSFGLVLIAILAASNIGTDYGWGTLRTVLVRGTGRWQYLGGKLLLLTLLTGAALLAVALGVALSSAIAGALASPAAAATTATSNGGTEWGDVAVTFGKAWFGVLPYLALAAFITVFTGSSAAGMAVSLAYYFLEGLLVAIFSALFEWFSTVAEFMLGPNISGWMAGTGAGGIMFGGGGLGGNTPGVGQAFAVLLVYIVALSGLAFWRFQKRDVAGASGT